MEMIDTRIYDDIFLLAKIFNHTELNKDEKERLYKHFEKRKKGEWILFDNQNREDVENGNYYYFCSNCNHGDLHAKTQEVPYCWYCGAKMEKKDE